MRLRLLALLVALGVVATLLWPSRTVVSGVGPRSGTRHSTTLDVPGPWESIGPSPMIALHFADPTDFQAGRVSSLAVDPSNPSRWLAGFGNGGVWESRDAGTS
jgi:hypothetical protein